MSWNDDPYTKKARQENYLARSIYKLREIEEKEHILQGAKTILDLGAAPGSWTQYCIERAPQAQIVAIDLSPIKVEHPRVKTLEMAVEDVDWSQVPSSYDVVLSDMAPKTSGVHDSDVAQSVGLAEFALHVAQERLRVGGHFVVKLFMGEGFQEYDKAMRAVFEEVKKTRPDSTRKHSREIFFIGKGKR